MNKKSLYGEQVVPQNSLVNVRHRLLESSAEQAESAQHCPHCENMAKNFLYLESLIRSNFNAKAPCKLCFSSLKYLQFVNKSIMQVFGNCDSIVNAAKAFYGPATSKAGAIKKEEELPKKLKRFKHTNSTDKATPREHGGNTGRTVKTRQKVAAKSVKQKSSTNLREKRLKKKIKKS